MDITDRKRTEEALKKARQELGFIIDSVPALIWQKDTEGRYVQVNKRYCDTVGLLEEDVLGRTDHELYPDVIADKYMQDDREVMASRTDRHGIEERHILPSGDSGWSLTDKMVCYDSKRNVKGTIGFALDITERKRTDEALRFVQEKYRKAFFSAPDAITISELDSGRFVEVNEAATTIFGYSREELIGKSAFELGIWQKKEDRAAFVDEIREHGRVYQYEAIERRKSGELFNAMVNADTLSIGGVNHLIAIIRDITERKRAEEQLKHFNEELESQVRSRTVELERLNILLRDEVIQRTGAEELVLKSLKEREFLLREVHHRVRNNLQIMLSLIRLQSQNIKDPGLLDTMGEFQNRIRAMAHVHERMYRAVDISRIDLPELCAFLGKSLFKSYKVDPQHIRLNVEMKDLQVGIDYAIPISLIINELVSNAITHAFPKGTSGEITIAGRREADTLVLSIRDTGIGIPKDLDWMRSTRSLGHRLVVSLVEQLNGTIELDRTTGTAFKIVVKEKP